MFIINKVSQQPVMSNTHLNVLDFPFFEVSFLSIFLLYTSPFNKGGLRGI